MTPTTPPGYTREFERPSCETCIHAYDNRGTVPSQVRCLTCKKYDFVVNEGDVCNEHFTDPIDRIAKNM